MEGSYVLGNISHQWLRNIFVAMGSKPFQSNALLESTKSHQGKNDMLDIAYWMGFE